MPLPAPSRVEPPATPERSARDAAGEDMPAAMVLEGSHQLPWHWRLPLALNSPPRGGGHGHEASDAARVEAPATTPAPCAREAKQPQAAAQAVPHSPKAPLECLPTPCRSSSDGVAAVAVSKILSDQSAWALNRDSVASSVRSNTAYDLAPAAAPTPSELGGAKSLGTAAPALSAASTAAGEDTSSVDVAMPVPPGTSKAPARAEPPAPAAAPSVASMRSPAGVAKHTDRRLSCIGLEGTRSASQACGIDRRLVTTTDDLLGCRVLRVLGLVQGQHRQRLGSEDDAAAAGGEVDSCEEALAGMVKQAEGRGANAVVAVRYSHSGGASFEKTVAYGTAVLVQEEACAGRRAA